MNTPQGKIPAQRKTVDIIGIPLDLGVSELGLKIGPDAFRGAGLVEIVRSAGLEVHDHGNISIEAVKEKNDSKARNVASIALTCEKIADVVSESVASGHVAVCLGGDHSLSIGSIAGAARAIDNIGCIWIDAHPDANTPDTSPSGNVHGMPVAILMGDGPEKLVNIDRPGAKVDYDKMFLVGCRDIDAGETTYLRDHDVRMFTIFDVLESGLPNIISEVVNGVSDGTNGVHVSLDLDALREEIAPGVGLRSSCGFDMREISYIVEQIARRCRIVSIDIVGLNPVQDNNHRTARVGIELLMLLLGHYQSCSYYDYIHQQRINGQT